MRSLLLKTHKNTSKKFELTANTTIKSYCFSFFLACVFIIIPKHRDMAKRDKKQHNTTQQKEPT